MERTYLNISFCIYVLLSSCVALYGQEQPILIRGKIIEKQDSSLSLGRVMIINKRTYTGIYASADGTFNIKILRKDTLMISAPGYLQQKIWFSDSLPKDHYDLRIEMEKLYIQLKEAIVFPVKKLEEVEKEFQQLGVKKTDTYADVQWFSSPVTYLYERFSRFERSKRLVALLENEERKKAALKDLFRIYVHADIIELSEGEFDDFIYYCQLHESFIRASTQYELVMYIKAKYRSFLLGGKNRLNLSSP